MIVISVTPMFNDNVIIVVVNVSISSSSTKLSLLIVMFTHVLVSFGEPLSKTMVVDTAL